MKMKSFALAPSLALPLLLASPAHSTKYFVPCRSNRPGKDADYRTLYIPTDYFSSENGGEAAPADAGTRANIFSNGTSISEAEDERRLARALCCVYVHVVVHPDCSNPWMEKYKGWQDVVGSSAAEAMESAMNEVCRMKMGSEDCFEKRECVEDAMEGMETVEDQRVADLELLESGGAASGVGAVAGATAAIGIWMGGWW